MLVMVAFSKFEARNKDSTGLVRISHLYKHNVSQSRAEGKAPSRGLADFLSDFDISPEELQTQDAELSLGVLIEYYEVVGSYMEKDADFEKLVTSVWRIQQTDVQAFAVKRLKEREQADMSRSKIASTKSRGGSGDSIEDEKKYEKWVTQVQMPRPNSPKRGVPSPPDSDSSKTTITVDYDTQTISQQQGKSPPKSPSRQDQIRQMAQKVMSEREQSKKTTRAQKSPAPPSSSASSRVGSKPRVNHRRHSGDVYDDDIWIQPDEVVVGGISTAPGPPRSNSSDSAEDVASIRSDGVSYKTNIQAKPPRNPRGVPTTSPAVNSSTASSKKSSRSPNTILDPVYGRITVNDDELLDGSVSVTDYLLSASEAPPRRGRDMRRQQDELAAGGMIRIDTPSPSGRPPPEVEATAPARLMGDLDMLDRKSSLEGMQMSATMSAMDQPTSRSGRGKSSRSGSRAASVERTRSIDARNDKPERVLKIDTPIRQEEKFEIGIVEKRDTHVVTQTEREYIEKRFQEKMARMQGSYDVKLDRLQNEISQLRSEKASLLKTMKHLTTQLEATSGMYEAASDKYNSSVQANMAVIESQQQIIKQQQKLQDVTHNMLKQFT
jgi:hypothetical protein